MTYAATTPPKANAGQINQAALNYYLQIPPQIEAMVYKELGLPTNNIYNAIQMFGRKMLRKPPFLSVEVEGKITANITTTGSASAASPNTDITLTLSTADHTNGKSFPRPGYIVTMPTQNYAQARIMAKDETNPTAHTITLHLIDAIFEISLLFKFSIKYCAWNIISRLLETFNII